MTPTSSPAGRRNPSMADVAALAGVSHQTVSRVLNDHALVKPETRELATVATLDLPVPVALAQGVLPGQRMAAGVDQERGAELAARHLVEIVGGPVAHVTGPLDWVEARMRRDGWLRVLATADAEGPELAGDWSARSGYEAGLALATDPTVAGVFVGNDAMALGLLRALHERGRRVPEDVAVVGFDDAPEAAHYWPPLSSVRQDFAEVGRRALDLAVRTLQGEESASVDLVVPELVVRRSSGGAT